MFILSVVSAITILILMFDKVDHNFTNTVFLNFYMSKLTYKIDLTNNTFKSYIRSSV